jgi:hypothetical protein
MRRLFHYLTLLALCGVSGIGLGLGIAAPVQADDEDPSRINPGICGLYYFSGHVVSTATGRIVPLEYYCELQDSFYVPAEELAEQETEAEAFWQRFLDVASPTAMDFARSAGKAEVVAYGQTICPFLEEGRSLSDLRQEQQSSGIPQSFEAAVTVAAIHAYCPAFQSQIGRE